MKTFCRIIGMLFAAAAGICLAKLVLAVTESNRTTYYTVDRGF